MLTEALTNLDELLRRGGLVMWPLLALSLVTLTLILERTWFFLRTNHPGQLAKVRQMGLLLRSRQIKEATTLAATDRSVYGQFVKQLLDEPDAGETAAIEALETQRHRLERFLPTLSTIITAAPMLGILGTVLGIIASFQLLSTRGATTDIDSVSHGIAEALLTTAVGLLIALVTLFPYNAFRTQVDRTLTRLESLAQAALHATANQTKAKTPATPPQSPHQAAPPAKEGSPTPLGQSP